VVGVTEDMIKKPADSGRGWEFFEKKDLPYHNWSGESDCGVIGLAIEEMKDEERLCDFKKRAFDLIKKALPDSDLKLENIGIHVDGGYNG
jgi:hypothetical protein